MTTDAGRNANAVRVCGTNKEVDEGVCAFQPNSVNCSGVVRLVPTTPEQLLRHARKPNMQSAIPPRAEQTPMMASMHVLSLLDEDVDVEVLLSAWPELPPPVDVMGFEIEVTENVASIWLANSCGIPVVAV